MKHITTIALLLTLGGATAYSRPRQVTMTFSGSFVRTALNLQTGTVTDEENFEGTGSLGPFTFRNLRADTTSPETSSTCTTGPFFRIAAGGGVLRFQDGNLLTVKLAGEGSGCVDLTAVPPQGHFTASYQITGGTGRFKGASGTLNLAYAAVPVVADASGDLVFLAASGEMTGTISGMSREDGHDDRQ